MILMYRVADPGRFYSVSDTDMDPDQTFEREKNPIRIRPFRKKIWIRTLPINNLIKFTSTFSVA